MEKPDWKKIACRRGTPMYKVLEFMEDEREYYNKLKKYCNYLEGEASNSSKRLVSLSFSDEELYIISNALQNEVESKYMKVEDVQFRNNITDKINKQISDNEC